DLHVFNQAVVDQQRAKQRLLRLKVVRKADARQAVVRRRRRYGCQCHRNSGTYTLATENPSATPRGLRRTRRNKRPMFAICSMSWRARFVFLFRRRGHVLPHMRVPMKTKG